MSTGMRENCSTLVAQKLTKCSTCTVLRQKRDQTDQAADKKGEGHRNGKKHGKILGEVV